MYYKLTSFIKTTTLLLVLGVGISYCFTFIKNNPKYIEKKIYILTKKKHNDSF